MRFSRRVVSLALSLVCSSVSFAAVAGMTEGNAALEKMDFWLVDCQVKTEHLGSLGARGIERSAFLEYLDKNAYQKTLSGKWGFSEAGGIECAAPG